MRCETAAGSWVLASQAVLQRPGAALSSTGDSELENGQLEKKAWEGGGREGAALVKGGLRLGVRSLLGSPALPGPAGRAGG